MPNQTPQLRDCLSHRSKPSNTDGAQRETIQHIQTGNKPRGERNRTAIPSLLRPTLLVEDEEASLLHECDGMMVDRLLASGEKLVFGSATVRSPSKGRVQKTTVGLIQPHECLMTGHRIKEVDNKKGTDEWSSNESGWTAYIGSPGRKDNDFDKDDDRDDRSIRKQEERKEDDSDDSMASDASSGLSKRYGLAQSRHGLIHAGSKSTERRNEGKKKLEHEKVKAGKDKAESTARSKKR